MTFTEFQLKTFADFLTTPFGVLALSFGVMLLALSLVVRQTKWAVLAGMLFVSTLSFAIDQGVIVQLMFPLEQLKPQGRGLTAALMGVLLVGFLVSPRGWRRKYLVAGTALFFVFEIVMSAELMFNGLFARGAASILLFILIFITLGVALPHALQQWDDAVSLVRAIVGFGFIFIVANLAQFIVNPGVIEYGGRFRGTTGNPQHAAELLATLILPMAYLMTRPGRSRLSRLAMGAAMSLTLVFLMWTGSRTGLFMLVLGVGVMFRARLGRLAIAGIVVAAMTMAVMSIVFPDRDVVSEHLVSTNDSRSHVWHQLLDDFTARPVFGTVDRGGDLTIRETSYLSVLARFGLVGAIPFGAALLLTGLAMTKLWRVGRRLEDPMMSDLVLAGLVQAAGGAMFEGYLAATLSPQVLIIYCYLALLAFLLEVAQVQPSQVVHVEDVYDEFAEHVESERGLPATW